MIFNRNPALWLSAIQAGIFLAVSFGIELTTDQETGLMGAAAAVASLLTGAAIRSQVFSPESHFQSLRAARSGSGG